MMLKKENKKPVRSANRTVDLYAIEECEVEVIGDVEEVSDGVRIEATTENALEEIFLPEYGGSD
jgi:hypothetical protein